MGLVKHHVCPRTFYVRYFSLSAIGQIIINNVRKNIIVTPEIAFYLEWNIIYTKYFYIWVKKKKLYYFKDVFKFAQNSLYHIKSSNNINETVWNNNELALVLLK